MRIPDPRRKSIPEALIAPAMFTPLAPTQGCLNKIFDKSQMIEIISPKCIAAAMCLQPKWKVKIPVHSIAYADTDISLKDARMTARAASKTRTRTAGAASNESALLTSWADDKKLIAKVVDSGIFKLEARRQGYSLPTAALIVLRGKQIQHPSSMPAHQDHAMRLI